MWMILEPTVRCACRDQAVMAYRQAMKLGFGPVTCAQQGSELPQHGGEGRQVGKSWEKVVGKVPGTLGEVRPLDGGGPCPWLVAYFRSCSGHQQSRENECVVGSAQGPVGTSRVSAREFRWKLSPAQPGSQWTQHTWLLTMSPPEAPPAI